MLSPISEDEKTVILAQNLKNESLSKQSPLRKSDLTKNNKYPFSECYLAILFIKFKIKCTLKYNYIIGISVA